MSAVSELRSFVVVVSLLLIVSGCGRITWEVSPPAPHPSAYSVPSIFGVSYYWTAAPGVDLTAPAAVATRAAVESEYLTNTTGHNEGYPGFLLFGSTQPGFRMDGGYPELTSRGTLFFHMISVSRRADGHFLTALCANDSQAAVRDKSGNLEYGTRWQRNREEYDLVPTVAGTEPTNSAGFGPARYPTNNVFAGWTLVYWNPLLDGYGPSDPCISTNIIPSEFRNFDRNNPPARTPTPGWPAS